MVDSYEIQIVIPPTISSACKTVNYILVPKTFSSITKFNDIIIQQSPAIYINSNKLVNCALKKS